MKSNYEIREIALALMGGEWTADDKDLFIIENAKQDEENQLTEEEIDRVFDVIDAEQAATE